MLKAEGLIGEEIIPDTSSSAQVAQVASYIPVEEMDTIASLLGDEEDEDLEELAAPTSSEPEIPASSASSASDASVPASSEPATSEPASSEEETVESDTPPSESAETAVASITLLAPEVYDAEAADEGFPKDLAVALPLTSHTGHSIANLICMIYTRGSLLSKATGGNFKANKALVDFILEEVEMATKDELIASINGQLEEEDKILEGLKLEADRIIFMCQTLKLAECSPDLRIT